MAKHPHVKKTTLIVVGEGAHDKAFLDHMKGIYNSRHSGQKVKIDSADGGSPHDVIKTAIKKTSHLDYDQKYILMDSDVPINAADLKLAKAQKITVLLSTPLCLEGMLLEVLRQHIPVTAELCKKRLHPQLAGKPVYAESYQELFPKLILDAAIHQTIIELRTVLNRP